MDSRISVRPAAFPDARCSETACAPNLAFAFLTLSAICSGLGLVVLGLEQGGTSRYRVWNCSGSDPLRRNATKSAALVVVFLVSRGLDSVLIDGDFSAGGRSVVHHVRSVAQGASGCRCLHSYTD